MPGRQALVPLEPPWRSIFVTFSYILSIQNYSLEQLQHVRHDAVHRGHVQHGGHGGLRHPGLLLAAQRHREPDSC